MMNLTVAVTGLHAGENPQPGVGVIRSLRRRYADLTVIGLVYDVLESGIYSDHCADIVFELPYPSAGEGALLQRLDTIHARYPIDVLIPTLDAEILPMIGLLPRLAERGIRTLLPERSAFEARRKSELMALTDRCGCLTPISRQVADLSGLLNAAAGFAYPMIIKGPFYEAYRVASQPALIEQFHYLMAKWGGPVILQECIHGQEFNVMAVGDGRGGVAALCAIRKMIRSQQGKGYGGIVIDDPALTRDSLALIRELRWLGPMELEFLQDEVSGQYYLLEINPRFPAWVDFPSTFGQNMPALVVEALVEGRMTPLPPSEPGYFYIRRTEDITCRVDDMGALTSLGEWRCQPFAESLACLA
jgi:carbamoyl-phosphate synthase large subunit